MAALTQAFRFMDLPKEIRLMVYEQLPRQIKHTEIRCDGYQIIVITKHLPTAILHTSRTIRDEALAIVTNLIRTFVQESQPRMIESKLGQLSVTHLIELIADEYRGYPVRSDNGPLDTSTITAIQHQESDVKAILSRHYHRLEYSKHISLVDNKQIPDSVRFIHQTTRAVIPGTNTWNNTIHSIAFKDPTLGIAVSDERYSVHIRNSFLSHRCRMNVKIKYKGLFVSPTRVRRPVVSVDNVSGPTPFEEDGNEVMSRETWVREWLSSVMLG
jgi:hypothetical protein